MTYPNVIIYRREDNRWAWRLTSHNGNIIATDGSQGYENRADAQTVAYRILDGSYSDHITIIEHGE